MSTVPHRHDLSMDHAVNQRIALVNFYIEELCLDRFGQSPTIRPPTSPSHAVSSCAASSTPLSSLPVQDRHQLSSEALQPVEPVIVGPLHRDQFLCDARTCFLETGAGATSSRRDDTSWKQDICRGRSTAVRLPPHPLCLLSKSILCFRDPTSGRRTKLTDVTQQIQKNSKFLNQIQIRLLHQIAESATNKLDEIQLMCAEMKTYLFKLRTDLMTRTST
ncbi:hypothetical protein J6590_044043 [Homalodisca vitripennis]|nr:hypothetical protein J6590_044043 [Homalodisca vitripennis]